MVPLCRLNSARSVGPLDVSTLFDASNKEDRVTDWFVSTVPKRGSDRHPPSQAPTLTPWGYSMEDAVIIDKNDPIVSKVLPFNGITIEHIFAEKRIYCELIV
jgi:hypothetical protein